tara:strand:- start:380 stop:946 length:567 start_codon:yes stop_codon:yes gene_type:complete
MNVELAVQQEIREWSRHALEKPNIFFNRLPACPYAKKAFEEEKVGYVFKNEDDNLCLYQTLAGFDDSYEVILLVDFCYKKDPEEFEDFISDLNDAIAEGIFGQKDLWLMGFHPDDDSEQLLDEGSFSPSVGEKYAIIFVQRLTKLQSSADQLKEKGYYKQVFETPENRTLYDQRETLHRRLTNGNETS